MSASSHTVDEPPAWQPHWASRSAYSIVSVFLYLSVVSLGISVYYENYWLAVPLVLICSHFMHSMLIGYHEASHGMLRKNRRLNEFGGLGYAHSARTVEPNSTPRPIPGLTTSAAWIRRHSPSGSIQYCVLKD